MSGLEFRKIKRTRFMRVEPAVRLVLFLSVFCLCAAHASGDLLIASDDSDGYPGFNNLLNRGSGFGEWFNGNNSDMNLISSQDLSGLNYWQIQNHQSLYRNVTNDVPVTEGRLELLAKHEAFGTSLSFSYSGFSLTDGGSTPTSLLTVSVEGDQLFRIQVTTGSGTYSSDTFSTSLENRSVDYSLSWTENTFTLRAVIELAGGIMQTNSVAGNHSAASGISGLGFHSAATGDKLGFDALKIYAVPEPAVLSLIVLSGGLLLLLKRRFTLLCILLLPFVNHTAEASEHGSWTNRSGHVLLATPVEMETDQITFQYPDNRAPVSYPLSVFPPNEQERLAQYFNKVTIPDGLKSAHTFARRTLKRSRLLLENGQISDDEYETVRHSVHAAFQAQAQPLVADRKITRKQIKEILKALK